MAQLRGLTKEQEQAPGLLIRDTRTIGQRVRDFLEDTRHGAIFMLVAAVATFLAPAFSDFILFFCFCIFLYSCFRRSTLPFRMPKRSGAKDYNDLIPGTSKPKKASGICFYGNEMFTQKELWFTNNDMRTHCLIFGSTGSGKTEALVSLAYNSLIQASGFIYVDGKGDNSLFAKVFSMVRSAGREDDMLLINFMTGARDIIGPQEKRLSNTLNPFANGSSSMLSQLVVSLMASSSSGSPDGDMWKGRAISFVEALMRILVYMRDQGNILLDASIIRDYFNLQDLESMVIDRIFPRKKDDPVSLADTPDSVLDPLYNYVINLPGYNKAKKGKQVSQVLEQHGFITMQLTRVFGSLADTYGHILRTNLAEVDLKDVVLNRRILVVLLPALEKAPEELANLGKIIIASLKAMMAAGLGEDVEGDYRDVVLRKPTNSPTPYVCILDEYGYYAVPGFAVVPAQARSLGFSVIFAGQDLPAFQKASKEEAASIGANTNIKISMKLEDPHETWEFFSKTAGESYVTKVDSFQTDAKSVLGNYLDTRSASAERRARIDLLDLKEQREGEAHIFFKSTIVRATLFFANPKPVRKLRLNHFLKVEAPTTRELYDMQERMKQFKALLDNNDLTLPPPEPHEEITFIAHTLQNDEAKTLIERGVAALLAFYNRGELEEEALDEELEEKTDEVDVFSKVKLNELTLKTVATANLEAFSAPLLWKNRTQQKIAQIERLSGNTKAQADDIGTEIINDMLFATSYPPVIETPQDPENIAQLAQDLAHTLEALRESGGDDTDDDGLF